jgi:hypothetical protein
MLGSITAQNTALSGRFGDNKGSDAPTTLTAHLYEGDPTDDGVEIAGTDYVPVDVANTTANLGTPDGGELGPFDIDFGTAGADDWGTPDFWAFTDGSGNFYDVQEISNPDEIANGDPVTLSATISAT